MGITDEKFLLCHGISEGRVDKQFSTRDYNNRKVYELFNILFPDDSITPDLNLPSITIDERTRPNKRARYSPDLLPASIYVASEKSVITLSTSYYSSLLLLLTSDDPNPLHDIKKYLHNCDKVKRGYCYRKHD